MREVDHYLMNRVGRDRANSRKNLRDLWLRSHSLTVTDPRFTFASYSQLVQELISGTVRRHTFTQPELELLLDLQNSRIRKSSKPDVLRRYLRAAHTHFTQQNSVLRFAKFMEREVAGKSTPVPPVFAAPAVPVSIA